MMAKVGVVAAGGRLRSHFYCLMLKKIQFFIICDETYLVMSTQSLRAARIVSRSFFNAEQLSRRISQFESANAFSK